MKHGKVFIYNVYFFENEQPRKNSERDVIALTYTFKRMNIDNDVEDLSDYTVDQIRTKVKCKLMGSALLRLQQQIKVRSSVAWRPDRGNIFIQILCSTLEDKMETMKNEVYRRWAVKCMYLPCYNSMQTPSPNHNLGFLTFRFVKTNEPFTLMKKDFTDYSYIAVAYFSHGTDDDMVATASNKELINEQKNILIPLGNISSLNGKLKWLIMQTCRGSYDFLKLRPEGAFPLVKYPKYYAKFFATSPGMRAYRTENGSLFINALCNRLEEEYKHLDIMSNVNKDVKEECEQCEEFSAIQTPEAEINFHGTKFYVTTGFKDN